MGNLMVKETTSMEIIKECIKETGETGKNKDLESLSLKINMDILEIGKIIKKTERDPTFTLMGKDMKEAG